MRLRFLVLPVSGIAVALLLGSGFNPLHSEEVPDALTTEPAQPTKRAKDLSRPFVEATRLVRPAVVKIYNMRSVLDRRGVRGLLPGPTGSGTIISADGHIITNRHVVLDAAELWVELHDGRFFKKVKLLGQDPRSDVAIIRITETTSDPLPVARLGDSDQLDVGEWVIAIGAPFQLASSVSVGVVSATGRVNVLRGRGSEEFIQTDAALNPGNSGGPLINLDGHVVGINTAIQTGGRDQASAGVGFAIPINLARTIAAALIEKGVAKRGYLGVRLLTDQFGRPIIHGRTDLEKMGARGASGWQIEFVEPSSPAGAAKLKKGQFITAVDGRDVRTLYARLAQAGPGGTVTLTINGKREVAVTLAEEQIWSYGIEVEDVDAAKAKELGIDAGTQGVVVTRIQDNSVAARAASRNRLMPGDVITRIDWARGVKPIQGKRDFEQLMARFVAEQPSVIRIYFRTKEGDWKIDLVTR